MRSTVKLLVTATSLLVLATTSAFAARPDSPGNGNGNGPKTCDAAVVDAAVAAIAAACPCEGRSDADGNVVPWKNHGQYVRCVAHATRDAIKASDGALHRRCLKESVRCAARSTCGRREGVVNCTTVLTSPCVGGQCANGDACATDEDCTQSSCSFRSSAEACVAGGGVPGTGSCCAPAPVGSPSGAFVDGAAFY